VSGFLDAASDLGVPLSVVDLDTLDVRETYPEKVVLVRPDQHIAWRGNRVPNDTAGLIALVSGRSMVPECPPSASS
jgi:hypothetical protein